MDMWNPYRDAVYEVNPEAIIIVDKFHVVKMCNEALEKIRRHINATIDKKKRSALRNSKYLLLRNMEDLSLDQQGKLMVLFDAYPAFKDSYYLKEEFRSIYDAKSKADAVLKYENWKLSAKGYPDFVVIAETVDNWHREIFNYFNFRYTNALTESLNKIINEIDNKGRGYTFEILRAKLLYGTRATKLAKYKYIKKDCAPSIPEGAMGFAYRFALPRTEKILVSGSGVEIKTLIEVIERNEFF